MRWFVFICLDAARRLWWCVCVCVRLYMSCLRLWTCLHQHIRPDTLWLSLSGRLIHRHRTHVDVFLRCPPSVVAVTCPFRFHSFRFHFSCSSMLFSFSKQAPALSVGWVICDGVRWRSRKHDRVCVNTCEPNQLKMFTLFMSRWCLIHRLHSNWHRLTSSALSLFEIIACSDKIVCLRFAMRFTIFCMLFVRTHS